MKECICVTRVGKTCFNGLGFMDGEDRYYSNRTSIYSCGKFVYK